MDTKQLSLDKFTFETDFNKEIKLIKEQKFTSLEYIL